MKRIQAPRTPRNNADEEIRELEMACARLLPDPEDGRSSEELTVVLAVYQQNLSAVVALLELEVAKRDFRMALHSLE
jgi:hypothetical protein